MNPASPNLPACGSWSRRYKTLVTRTVVCLFGLGGLAYGGWFLGGQFLLGKLKAASWSLEGPKMPNLQQDGSLAKTPELFKEAFSQARLSGFPFGWTLTVQGPALTKAFAQYLGSPMMAKMVASLFEQATLKAHIPVRALWDLQTPATLDLVAQMKDDALGVSGAAHVQSAGDLLKKPSLEALLTAHTGHVTFTLNQPGGKWQVRAGSGFEGKNEAFTCTLNEKQVASIKDGSIWLTKQALTPLDYRFYEPAHPIRTKLESLPVKFDMLDPLLPPEGLRVTFDAKMALPPSWKSASLNVNDPKTFPFSIAVNATLAFAGQTLPTARMLVSAATPQEITADIFVPQQTAGPVMDRVKQIGPLFLLQTPTQDIRLRVTASSLAKQPISSRGGAYTFAVPQSRLNQLFSDVFAWSKTSDQKVFIPQK